MSELPATRVIETAGQPIRASFRRYQLRIVVAGAPARVETVDTPTLRVGSRPGNDVVLADPTVSRIHFEIAGDRHGFRLRDLGSTNGTTIDGIRVVDAYLRPGALIRAGATELGFEPLASETELVLAADDRFEEMIGASVAMRRLFATLPRIAKSDATVLIEGESGTGKELIAEALHRTSDRAGRAFVVFDCAAVTASLLEAELFGHERGAFTGAHALRAGCLELADGGTLFVDEIGELPLDLQPKLLRCLERGEFRRVGSTETRKVDVRVITATNRDLAAEVNAGSFREDLYYRLAVVRLVVPPLRERTGDIPLLVESFLAEHYDGNRARVIAAVTNLGERVWKQLAAWPWRGNVRELRNTVARAVALAGDELPTELTPLGSRAATGAAPSHVGSFAEQRDAVLAGFERELLTRALERSGGNVPEAARAVGLDRSYFRRLLRKHGIAGS